MRMKILFPRFKKNVKTARFLEDFVQKFSAKKTSIKENRQAKELLNVISRLINFRVEQFLDLNIYG